MCNNFQILYNFPPCTLHIYSLVAYHKKNLQKYINVMLASFDKWSFRNSIKMDKKRNFKQNILTQLVITILSNEIGNLLEKFKVWL